MTSKKREAAANVFRQQNAMIPAELEEALLAKDEQPAFQAQAPLAGLAPPAAPRLRAAPEKKSAPAGDYLVSSEELQLSKEPIPVREVGQWPFKRVIVPPNVYVVHTRLGRKDPITIGLGLSFHFNPYTDAYLVVPAAMQTIGIVANSISREKQGINVLAYVQWQIHDFSVAYRKLDFSDTRDPLGIVNAQLREQAEAAIKDKIATMSVEEVLTDKAPIIEELTARLKAVAEGRSDGNQAVGEGLGIKIVTVQIKEAYVSSQTLWEHLQAPFRYEKAKAARISQLLAQDEIRKKELENRKLAETSEAETMVEIELIKQNTETEALQTRLAQENARFTREQAATREKTQLEEQTVLFKQQSEQRLRLEAARAEQERKLAALAQAQEEAVERTRLDTEAKARQKTLQIEQALKELAEETRLAENKLQADRQRLERETELKKLDSQYALFAQERDAQLQRQAQEAELARNRQERLAQLELEEATNKVRLALAEKETEIARLRQEAENLVNQGSLANRLIGRLPELAAQMPEVHELKILQTGNDGYDSLAAFLARVMALAESFGFQVGNKKAAV